MLKLSDIFGENSCIKVAKDTRIYGYSVVSVPTSAIDFSDVMKLDRDEVLESCNIDVSWSPSLGICYSSRDSRNTFYFYAENNRVLDADFGTFRSFLNGTDIRRDESSRGYRLQIVKSILKRDKVFYEPNMEPFKVYITNCLVEEYKKEILNWRFK